jgi:hypothetical protein
MVNRRRDRGASISLADATIVRRGGSLWSRLPWSIILAALRAVPELPEDLLPISRHA